MGNRIKFQNIGPEKCSLSIHNESETEIWSTEYHITVFNNDKDCWETYVTGNVTLQPLDSWSREFYQQNGNGWNSQIFSNSSQKKKE